MGIGNWQKTIGGLIEEVFLEESRGTLFAANSENNSVEIENDFKVIEYWPECAKS